MPFVIRTAILAAMLAALLLPTHASATGLTIYSEQGLFMKDESGKLIGIFSDIVGEIVRRSGTRTTITEVPWKRGMELVRTNKNAALMPTTLLPERKDLYQWVGPIMRLKWVLYKRKGSPIDLETLDDAKRVRSIGVYEGDAKMKYLVQQGFKNLDVTNENLLNARKLMEGRIDLLAGTNIGTFITMERIGRSIKDIEPAFTFKQVDLYLAFSLNADPALVELWRKTLLDMKRDGTFQRLYRARIPHAEPPVEPLPQDLH